MPKMLFLPLDAVIAIWHYSITRLREMFGLRRLLLLVPGGITFLFQFPYNFAYYSFTIGNRMKYR